MENEEFNFFEEKPLDQVSLAELDAIIKKLFDERKEIEAMEDAVSARKLELESLKERVKGILEANNKPNYPTQYGTVYTQTKYQVSMPKDPSRAAQLRAYFAKRNMEDMLTVNHMALNAFFNSVVEEKKALGESIDMSDILPGVEEPTARVTLAMKKGK